MRRSIARQSSPPTIRADALRDEHVVVAAARPNQHADGVEPDNIDGDANDSGFDLNDIRVAHPGLFGDQHRKDRGAKVIGTILTNA